VGIRKWPNLDILVLPLDDSHSFRREMTIHRRLAERARIDLVWNEIEDVVCFGRMPDRILDWMWRVVFQVLLY
jgi:hypothetical protein